MRKLTLSPYSIVSISSPLIIFSEVSGRKREKATGPSLDSTMLISRPCPVADIFTPWPCRMAMCGSAISASAAVFARHPLTKTKIGTLGRSKPMREAGVRREDGKQDGSGAGVCSGLVFRTSKSSKTLYTSTSPLIQ